MKKIMLITLAFLLAACSSSSSEGTELFKHDQQEWTYAQKAELRLNQQKWEDANISHYRFNYSVGCFCEDSPGYTIDVRYGIIISVVHSDGSAITGLPPFITIDGLFSKLQPDARKEVDVITAAYDPIYGFPTMIEVNGYKVIADEERTYYVSKFEVLP